MCRSGLDLTSLALDGVLNGLQGSVDAVLNLLAVAGAVGLRLLAAHGLASPLAVMAVALGLGWGCSLPAMPAPIKVSEHGYALPIAAGLGGPTTIFPALILDGPLVDTGIPGMQNDFQASLQALDLGWGDVKRVIVTHHDRDHLGSLPAIVAATGAEVLAPAAEVPYIQGDLPSQKRQAPEMVARLPEALRATYDHPPTARMDRALEDGERLDIAGGVRVVATPGHTVGHASLCLERDGVLISGDALTSDGSGQPRGPPAGRMTVDMD